MSEPKLISPLLDGFIMGKPMSNHDGVVCCPAIEESSDKKYIVKIISVPASQRQLDALLLTGAYKDPAAALEYFKSLSDDVIAEAELLQKLSKLEGFLPYEKWQTVPMENNHLGYDIYLLGAYKRSLEKYMRRNPVSHLAAVNLGLDLCAAMTVARKAGYLYVDLKPANIFMTEDREFRVGDLGFVSRDHLKYASLPNKYHSAYTAPEMRDPMATINETLDTYAIGMVLYQIYNNGILPKVPNHSEEPLAAPLNADYEIAEIILKACAPDPKDRWETPAEMGQALAAYMQRNTINDDPICPPMGIIPETAEPIAATAEETQASPAEDADITPVENEQDDDGNPEVEPMQELVVEKASPVEETVPADEETAVAEVTPVITEPDEIIPDEASETESDAQETKEEVPAQTIQIPVAVAAAVAPEEDSNADAQKTMVIETADPRKNRAALHIFDDDYDDDYEDEEYDADEDVDSDAAYDGKKKKKNPFVPIIVVLLVCALVVGGYFFYKNYYLLNITELEVTGHHNQITVTVDTDIDESLLTVVVSDTYGNTKRMTLTDGQAVFTDLSPDTLYQVQLEVSGFHKLTGPSYGSYITAAETKIVNFTGITGSEDGSVVLSFGVEGPEKTPDWEVTYSAEGEDPITLPISGHTVTISGLTVGKVYTFSLAPTTDLYMVGENTLEFTASKIVLAEDLKITACADGNLTAVWAAPADTAVESWNVRCYSDDGVEETITTTETTCTFSGIQPGKAYTVEVTAAGMTQTVRTTISANPITITAVSVDDSDPEALTVTWEFSGEAPTDGWQMLYYIDNSETPQVARSETNSAVIPIRVPGATYTLVFQTTNGSTVLDDSFTYACPDAEEFNSERLMLGASVITSNLLRTPKDNWGYQDVNGSRDYTDTFQVGDRISMLLHADVRSFYLYADATNILFVIRDGDGNVLQNLVKLETSEWDNIWNDDDIHYGELDLPAVPDQPGDYTVYVYFNGGLVATNTFTITE